MSEYKSNLETARKRQIRFYVFGGIIFFGAILTIGLVLLSAGGTPVIVTPNAAYKTANVSVIKGTALSVDNVIYSLSESVSIVVVADGYNRVERIVESHEMGQNITINLVESMSRLVVSTEPSIENTRWFIDGNLINVGATLDQELEPGPHKLKIDSLYYKIAEQNFDSIRGETIQLMVNIEAVMGTLLISTQPVEALVTINGKVVKKNPFEIIRRGGVYDVSVSSRGYTTIDEQVEITNTNYIVKRDYLLMPLSADLVVLAEPKGGILILNGKHIDAETIYKVKGNSSNTISYHKEGYIQLNMELVIEPEDNETVNILLTPDIGNVDIKSSPSAEIYIDEKYVGVSPTTLRLQAIPINIEFRKSGYISTKQRITPSRKRTIEVFAILQTEKSAALIQNAASYINSLGMELKRFRPAQFTMGAPRSEKGQRANEFQINVIFNKMFYSSMHEVTNTQYQKYNSSHSATGNLPVVGISWIEAAMFCNWLSEKEKRQPFYRITNARLISFSKDADGYRLLTEAEWEWLARKSGKTIQTIFPWGDDIVVPQNTGNIADESANGVTTFYVPNYNDGHTRLAPIGSYPPEASGLFDITGNASEWVHNYYSLTPPRKQNLFIDPLGSMVGDTHVVKGSSWRSGTRSVLRAAYRYGLSSPKDDVGFRIGRYLSGGENAVSN